jgi:hypothetical protein
MRKVCYKGPCSDELGLNYGPIQHLKKIFDHWFTSLYFVNFNSKKCLYKKEEKHEEKELKCKCKSFTRENIHIA